jgi:hypothetical protein
MRTSLSAALYSRETVALDDISIKNVCAFSKQTTSDSGGKQE